MNDLVIAIILFVVIIASFLLYAFIYKHAYTAPATPSKPAPVIPTQPATQNTAVKPLFTYVGCYKDTAQRVFNKMAPSPVTVEECAKIAAAEGAPAFGMQYPRGNDKAQCWYKYNSFYDVHGTATCATADASGNKLGGTWINSVYKF
jgi:hypothetical protein